MAWFQRKGPKRAGDPATPDGPIDEPSTDTVGNPILMRQAGPEPRHSAPETGITRAERRMLEFVADGRVGRTDTGTAKSSFWRIDGAFATGTKGMMLDWLLEQGYIAVGQRVRVVSSVVVTDEGERILAEGH